MTAPSTDDASLRRMLRRRLAERVPPGGSEQDTLFTESEIQDFLDQAGGDLDLASYYGWESKAAELANLVTVSEGNSARQMSDLHKAALEELARYDPDKQGASSKRIKMHRLSRPFNS